MKITIKNQEVELKNTMRSILIYEKITDKLFQPKTMSDMLVYFYSVILASKNDIDLTFNDLLDAVDDDPTLFEDFNAWMTTNNDKDTLINNPSKKKVKH